jgi:RNA polymerase sigma factor (sigma-70 family)
VETDIIQEFKSGNDPLFYELYKSQRNNFIRWACFQYSISEDDAKDIYQEMFIIFYRNIHSGKLRSLTCDVKTYLFGIGRHLILNHLKKSNRMVTLTNNELINGYENPIEMNHQKQHNKKIVEDNMNRLPEKDREILRLYYMEGLDMKTIAERLGYKNSDVAKKKKYEVFKKLSILVKSSMKSFML